MVAPSQRALGSGIHITAKPSESLDKTIGTPPKKKVMGGSWLARFTDGAGVPF